MHAALTTEREEEFARCESMAEAPNASDRLTIRRECQQLRSDCLRPLSEFVPRDLNRVDADDEARLDNSGWLLPSVASAGPALFRRPMLWFCFCFCCAKPTSAQDG